jgi:hypothetical protein
VGKRWTAIRVPKSSVTGVYGMETASIAVVAIGFTPSELFI